MNTRQPETTDLTEIFGKPIATYTRAQFIADGGLVEIPREISRGAGLLWPAGITREAYAAAVEAGMKDGELRGGQSITGRLHDVCSVFAFIAKVASKPGQRRLNMAVAVDTYGNGRRRLVRLAVVSGPDDNGEPCLTFMLPNQD
jgi:hypothetical protein